MDLIGNKKRNADILVCLLFFIAVFLFFTRPIGLITDFWWHISTGRWIWENGSLPSQDPFLFTSPKEIDTRGSLILRGYWLAQVTYYLIYSVSGFWGLVVLKAAVFTSLYYVLHRILLSSGLNLYTSLAVVSVVIPFSVDFDEVRPQTFSFLGALLLFFLLEKGLKKTRGGENPFRTALVFIPLLMAIWSNLHPGYILGLALLAIYALTENLSHLKAPLPYRKEKNVLFIGAALASALNPNIFKTLFVIASEKNIGAGKFAENITEHKHPWEYYLEFGYAPHLYGLIALTLITFLLLVWSRKRLTASHCLVFALFFVAGALYFRYTVFFVLFAPPIALATLPSRSKNSSALIKLSSIVALLSIGFLLFGAYKHSSLKRGPVSTFQAENAVKAIQAAHLPANIFNPYEWGGFLTWHLYPDYRPFTDARTLDYPTYLDYKEAVAGKKSRVFKDHNIQTVIFYLNAPTVPQIPALIYSLLKDDKWNLVYNDPYSVVFSAASSTSRQDKNQYMDYLIRRFTSKALASPNDVDPYLVLGQLHYVKGNASEAMNNFVKANRVSPNNFLALNWIKYLSNPNASQKSGE